jgi:hypothetical protein
VLDGFAAWDDMFRREIPRVENRRDPSFANLVQAAIEASPGFSHRLETPAFKVIESHSAFVTPSRIVGTPYKFEDVFTPHQADTELADELPIVDALLDDSAADALPTEEPAFAGTRATWPTLRLATIADPKPPQPNPHEAPGPLPEAASFDDPSRDDFGGEDAPTAVPRSAFADLSLTEHYSETTRTKRPLKNDTPILVVEEDPPPAESAAPPVRHEEYRDLFSRLRGD